MKYIFVLIILCFLFSFTPVAAQANKAIYQGPLSDYQRALLLKSSYSRLANTHLAAIKVSKALGESHPSNICGPLAASFLIDAGVLQNVTPYDFWLLNPDPKVDAWKLDKWFPSKKFARFDFFEAVGTFDFKSFPLYAGDFVYLSHSGPAGRGNYDHMLTVTRVDSLGRAYTVTNVHIGDWPDGFGEFVIKEVMLYDPNHPGIGQFADYNNPKFAKLGLTGFKFFVIRLK